MKNDNLELLQDLPLYASVQLHVRDKSGKIIPFQMNRAQKYVHDRLEEQRKRTGRVRAIILKGRQQGMSTYISARFFHKAVTNKGVLVFIFAHDSTASANLFNMVKTYYDTASDPTYLPLRGATNAKELLFPGLLSGYKVGTAGTGEGLGRSATYQAVHWSEVAFSPNCDEHASGLMQTVPDAPGTEVILESTANGQTNYYYRAFMQAIAGKGDFQAIFVPWYWQDEYVRDDTGYVPDGEDQALMELYGPDGLTYRHLAWRRAKIVNDFQGDVYRFRREYPNNAQEAFQQSEENNFIKSDLILRARNTPPPATVKEPPLIMGVDPARLGGDKFKIALRKGRTFQQLITLPPMRIDLSADRVVELIRRFNPARVNIDTGGLGVGVLDNLIRAGFGRICKGVAFGSTDVMYPERFYNKRAEMYGLLLEWLQDGPVSINIPPAEADALQAELVAIKVKRYTANNALVLVEKEEIKDMLGYSPDTADALALTFASVITEDKSALPSQMMDPIYADTSWSPFG